MSVCRILLILLLAELTKEQKSTTSPTTAYTLGSDLLYPYGSGLDQLSPQSDDGGPPLLSLPIGVPIFGKVYSSVFLNNNGFLSFDGNITSFPPPSISVSYPNPFLAPFWSDVDNTKEGSIYYRQTNDSNLLVWATSQLKTYFRLYKFTASWIYVATWDSVPYYASKTSQRNTFQVVLISNGKLTFVLYNYKSIQWPRLVDDYLSGVYALVSLNNGNGTSNYTLPGSLTGSMTNLMTDSNVKVAGRWAFNIDSMTVNFTNTFIVHSSNQV